jgi:hypothetical protein
MRCDDQAVAAALTDDLGLGVVYPYGEYPG